jgi:hypothetical protein
VFTNAGMHAAEDTRSVTGIKNGQLRISHVCMIFMIARESARYGELLFSARLNAGRQLSYSSCSCNLPSPMFPKIQKQKKMQVPKLRRNRER